MGTTSGRLRGSSSARGLKVAFDEHVPTALAKAFIAFSKEKMIGRISKGIIWEKAEDYAPKPSDKDYIRKSDVPWLDRFAAAGGHAVVSGDVKMRSRPHEKLALYNHGFVVVFFEPQWAQWSGLRKSALMLHWWDEITTKIRNADRGTFWVVPCAWPAKGGDLRNASLGLAKLLKDAPGRKEERRPSRQRRVSRPKKQEERQSAFLSKFDGVQS